MSVVEIIKYGFAPQATEMGAIEAVTKGCVAVHGKAVALAPTDTGRLRNSYMWRTSKEDGGFNSQPKEKAASDEQLDVRPKKLEGYVGTNLDYATYVEFGTRNQAAQPTLRFAGEIAKGSKTKAEVIAEQRKIMDAFERRRTVTKTVKRG